MRRARPRRTGASTAVAAVVLALATAGCGIRSMDVPVDDGPAPTRASCAAPEGAGGTEVFLVCDARVESVERELDRQAPPEEPAQRIALANALLGELQGDPPDEERAAGFTTNVPEDLRVTGAADDRDEPLLRLNRHPDDLPAFALAQVICTFAQSEVFADDAPVTLGGPDTAADRRERQYTCTSAVRHRPDTLRPAAP
ncbi:hypothetical protein [Streptomyces bohaiensis]|uniref:Lipoprotein n=1 Tax=Streptomyces bohaiensis TaxID=1431344 RepID=A0ABX1CK20_9ACTN|nr:hypothetical protein [Streptomyces bohaiensis]NJQ17482.1 hypothetical protein [Streptomyces bohaiensis]